MQTLPTYTLVMHFAELTQALERQTLPTNPCSVEGLRMSSTDVIHSLIFKANHERLD
jgi:hypothetical protein